MNKSEKVNPFIIVLFLLIAVLVFFFPKIYSVIETSKLPKVEKAKESTKVEKKEVSDEVLESLHFPLMRTSIYNKDTYYSLDKFKISDMKNEDILYNAFLDIYEGNFVGEPKTFDANYIDLRIKNILGRDIKYTNNNFIVPSDSSSKYKGTWNYDSTRSAYVYTPTSTSSTGTIYYNLEEFIKAEYDNDNVIAYYYVGFAKVENNNYTIYNDAKMTNEISKGTFTNLENLNNIYKSLNTKDKKIYKYIFKNTLCTYNEYCLYEGAWVDSVK